MNRQAVIPEASPYRHFADILKQRSVNQKNDKALIFIEDGETETTVLTFGEIFRKILTVSQMMVDQGTPGKRAILIYEPGPAFVIAFYACLYTRTLAIPVYPPMNERDFRRIQSIIDDANAEIVLASDLVHSLISQAHRVDEVFKGVSWIVTDSGKKARDDSISLPDPAITEEDIAFLQYTSGSTGNPKGVMVTHGNLMHNQAFIKNVMGHSKKTMMVTWLPLYHDMGLVGNLLHPMYLGTPCVLMPPYAFLQKPVRWLKVISAYRGTTSGGPNFAYELCINKVTAAEKKTLDLRCWDVAFNGAEPVNPRTLDGFYQAFKSCGLKREALYPCYGMAESTLIVTGVGKKEPPKVHKADTRYFRRNAPASGNGDGRESAYVSCGKTFKGHQVIIVDHDTCEALGENAMGEIWVSGPSVAKGYWNKPEETKRCFQAYTRGDSRGPFLRTGDIGYLHHGDLYVVGRLKDLIVIHGKNYYPQDIEETVTETDPALRPGCCAVFSVPSGRGEAIVALQEVRKGMTDLPEKDKLIQSIQTRIQDIHHLTPLAIVLLQPGGLKKTTSGKIKRHACKAAYLDGTLKTIAQSRHPAVDPIASTCADVGGEDITNWLIRAVASKSGLASHLIDHDTPFIHFGFSSVDLVGLSGELEALLGISLSPTIFYDYPTLTSLDRHLKQRTERDGSCPPVSTMESHAKGRPAAFNEPIAIIGMACRFPGADNTEAFWDLLWENRHGLKPFPEERRRHASDTGGYYGGYMEKAAWFDHRFFSMSPSEALGTDPQHRLLLETGWEALENAGIHPDTLSGSSTGVFVGIGNSDYYHLQASEGNSDVRRFLGVGHSYSMAANRLSYTFNLKGPSMAIDTACSSSLVAVHKACQSLCLGECAMAFVGGVNLILSTDLSRALTDAGMIAADGQCKTFDDRADGYGRGEGCGMVILKRLSHAKKDGDRIDGIIRGSAINQDGRTNGLTAPNGIAQSAVVTSALTVAGVQPNALTYVEAHGTGTALGDPIEINALIDVLSQGRASDQPCYIGSVKPAIGHLEAAAGMAGLIKTVLSLKKGKIPGTYNVKKINPHIRLDHTPFIISADNAIPTSVESFRLAGVSSFGFGGTNAHVILENPLACGAADQALTQNASATHSILTLSARSASALRDLAEAYGAYLKNDRSCEFSDICHTAALGRKHHFYRKTIVAKDGIEASEMLTRALLNGEWENKRTVYSDTGPAFIFSGQGSQYESMGMALYDAYPEFRKKMDACDNGFSSCLGFSIIDAIKGEGQHGSLHDTMVTQPALFAIEYALSSLWLDWGILPSVLIGHSIGEYVAACIAGALTLDEAIMIVSERASLFRGLEKEGRMLSVHMNETDLEAMLPAYKDTVDIAAINTPDHTVVSGDATSIHRLEARLKDRGISTAPLNVSHAFHSHHVDPCLDAFDRACAHIVPKKITYPLMLTATGRRLEKGEMIPKGYWRDHLRGAVRFSEGMETVLKGGCSLFLEVGPGSILCNLGRYHDKEKTGIWCPSLLKNTPECGTLLSALGRLYENGSAPNWHRVCLKKPYTRVALPTYPFQRKEFFVRMKAASPPGNDIAVTVQTTPPAAAASTPLEAVVSAIRMVSEIEVPQEDYDTNVFELGLDSLRLIQLKDHLEMSYGLTLNIESFFDSLDTVRKIADYIRGLAPPLPDVIPETPVPVPDAAPGPLSEIIDKQLSAMKEVMAMQLAMVQGKSSVTLPTVSPERGTTPPKADTKASPPLNFRSMTIDEDDLTETQHRFIDAFIKTYTQRTRKSKERADAMRPVLSDWIPSLGFRMSLKELQYPIVSAGSQGAKFTDIDGNTYIDLAIGYGVNFLGNRCREVEAAVVDQVRTGYELGPQCNLAGEVAHMITRLTGVERVAFCNTGSEAVMVALRIARAVTGKEKMVLFKGAYHGTSDLVLAGAYPGIPGSVSGLEDQVMALDYGMAASLDIISENARDIACVLVEPVQSRRPGFHPKSFLKKLRKLTRDMGIALIFDEVLTGFRIHPGGAQAWFDVQADIVLYGKIAGGGMPLGVVAGSSAYLDSIDGGQWSYGDHSYPEKEMSFFAGTFCKHPLAMAASRAALSILLKEGPSMQRRVNDLTAHFALRMNRFFTDQEVPIRVEHFGSLFRFESFGAYHLMFSPIDMDFFFFLLMGKGVYTWERRVNFFSVAHTKTDCDEVERAVRESIREMKRAGFFKNVPKKIPAEETILPATSAQKRLYFLSRLPGGSSAYTLAKRYHLKGELDVDRLERSIQSVIRRHECFRTAFAVKEDHICRLMSDAVRFSIDYKDLSHQPEQGESLLFDRDIPLETAPLIYVGLRRLSRDAHILCLKAHHLIVDGLSADIFLTEVAALYTGDTPAKVTRQFNDYTAWLETYMRGQAYKGDEAYWKKSLQRDVAPLDLPTDYPRRPGQNFAGGQVVNRWDRDKVLMLRALARQTGTTMNMVLLSAFYILLYKLTGRNDIAVGSPVAGRPRGFDSAVGMFANTVVWQHRVSGDLVYGRFIEQLKGQLISAYDHMNYPFEDLVKLIGGQRNAERNPLFDVTFVYEKGEARTLSLTHVDIDPLPDNKENVQFDLNLEVLDQENTITLLFEYRTALFKKDTVERFAGYFDTITDSISGNPGIPIKDIYMLLPHERRFFDAGFNLQDYRINPEHTVIELFRETVRENPDRPALRIDDREMSYADLDRITHTIACNLKTMHGVSGGDVVGILMARNQWAVIGFIGVLKAGATYLPIDPDYPPDRVDYMVTDSSCRLILSDREMADTWSASSTRLLNIRDLQEPLPLEKSRLPSCRPRDLCYIIYTSGSTGKPKGCGIEHRNLANYLLWARGHYFNSRGKGHFGLYTSLSFDLTITSIFLPLVMGGSITIYDEGLSVFEILEKMFSRQSPVDSVKITPAHISLLTEVNTEKKSMAVAIIGGEQLEEHHVNILWDIHPEMALFNEYGPTEATVGCVVKQVTPGDKEITIGRPIANTTLYILDPDLSPVPQGTAGELYIGGSSVARGYINDPVLSREKFVRVDLPGHGNVRLYKTGDLCLYEKDGELKYLGRNDAMMKINGVRIEPGEIKEALLTHPAVLDAVIRGIDGPDGGASLAAYIKTDRAVDPKEMVRFLKQLLPGAMIPGVIISMTRFPVTVNGKIDMHALPVPLAASEASCDDTPSEDHESLVARAWKKVLQVPAIRRMDNYFELGGDSIKAVALVSRLRELGVDADVTDIFKFPTFGEYAVHVQTHGGGLPPVTPCEQKDVYPVSNAQKRIFLIDSQEPGAVAYNMHKAFLLKGSPDIDKLEEAFQYLIRRHDALRTSFDEKGGRPVQIVNDAWPFSLHRMVLSGPEKAARIKSFYMAEAVKPFDLKKGRLVSATVISLEKRDEKTAELHVLFVNIHHIISDGWSNNILFRELSHIYNALISGSAPRLPLLPIQYKDYALWQQGLDGSPYMDACRAYWRDTLKDLNDGFYVTGDKAAVSDGYNGAWRTFRANEDAVPMLTDFSKKHDTTLFTVLTAIANLVLYHETGKADIITGTPVSGRHDPVLENQVGFYLNLLPLRITIREEERMGDFIPRVKKTTEAALSRQVYPYDVLAQDHGRLSSRRGYSLFNVLINLDNLDTGHLEFEGIKVKSLMEASATSVIDLNLMFALKETLSLTIEYNTEMFTEEKIDAFARRILSLIEQFPLREDHSLGEITADLYTALEQEEQDAFLQSMMAISDTF